MSIQIVGGETQGKKDIMANLRVDESAFINWIFKRYDKMDGKD